MKHSRIFKNPLRPLLIAASILTLSVLLAACGGGSSSDEEEINSLVRTFLQETTEGDASKAYDLLDAQSRQNCTLAEFEEQAGFVQETLALSESELTIDRVEDINVNGDTATAKVYTLLDGEGGDGDPGETPFRKEDGKWRLSDAC